MGGYRVEIKDGGMPVSTVREVAHSQVQTS